MTDPLILGLAGIAGMFLLIALHVPIGVAMCISGLIAVASLVGLDSAITLFRTEPSAIFSSRDLALIPLFLLMGAFAGAAGLSSDIYRLAYALVGHWRGGLAMATIGGCAGFGTVCGSSIATVATMTRVALPEMRKRRYRPTLATGCVAAGGTLGMLIPPSIIMVLYAVLTEQFVLTLFVAALVPGLIAVALHFVAISAIVRLDPEAGPAGPKLTWPERWTALRQSWAVVVLAVVVTGGIYAGVFTVAEAAAVGATMALGFAILRGKLSLKVLWGVLGETAANTGMIYLIIIGASIFTFFITLSQLPTFLVEGVEALGLPPLVVIFLLHVMYLVLGSIFDTVAAMVITLPIVFPLVIGLGYDPIWWGVINVMVIEIGMITPPIGINVFVLHGMARSVPLATVFRGILPFLAADLTRLVVLTVFPVLSLWLPDVLGAPR